MYGIIDQYWVEIDQKFSWQIDNIYQTINFSLKKKKKIDKVTILFAMLKKF